MSSPSLLSIQYVPREFHRKLAESDLFIVVITDPNDSNFDLEAYLTMKMADEAK